MTRWTAVNIPDQHGRTVIVTGANSGLGAETTRVLAKAGAKVIMACRNPDKGKGGGGRDRRNHAGAPTRPGRLVVGVGIR